MLFRSCNTAAVDLEPVGETDAAMLFHLISRHVEYTASPRGKWILENWDSMLEKFIKIFPHEYKRVLKQKEAQGLRPPAPALVSTPGLSSQGAARG